MVVNGVTVRVEQDQDPMNPRTDWDTFTTIGCWHRRMNLGDTQIDGGMTEEDVREMWGGDRTVLAILPVYCYQHSGITVSTEPFGCSMDSGQVGWAYITKEKAEKMGYYSPFWVEEHLERIIREEVATYAKFLEGEVYGYVIEDEDGNHLDSCWGFFGYEDAEEQGKEAAKRVGDDLREERAAEADRIATIAAEELSGRATFAAGA